MFTLIIVLLSSTFLKCFLAQVATIYPYQNYNYNNLQPTFSDLNVQSLYTTPSPYGNVYATSSYNQVDYNKIRIWPFVIDQYLKYPNNYNPYNNIAATLPTYTDQSYNYPMWYQPYLGRK
ncbi:uncharacterized protein ACRADG_002575 [Cochliomyia hominivorax]